MTQTLANTQRLWVLTIQRFAEMSWTRHGALRYASVMLVPAVVALGVPGLWWLACGLGAGLAMFVDWRIQGLFEALSAQLGDRTEEELRQLVTRQIWAIAIVAALYIAPYVALAFAPAPGPLLGLIYCAGAALICATLHVMTPTMVFYTIPIPALGLALNAAALTHGWFAPVAGALGF